MHWLPAILTLPYLIIIFLIYRNLLRIKPFVLTIDPKTPVTIIVACRNEEHNLPDLLASLSKQEYPSSLLEIIIIDDNSSDNTFNTACNFSGDSNIITIKNSGSGKKQAIRTGINIASGQLIITTDADCRHGIRWIKSIAAYYETHEPDLIIAPVTIDSGNNLFGKFQEIEFLSLQGITAGTVIAGNGTMCNGANLAFTKTVYKENAENLHDEIQSGDDVFLLHSVKKSKGAIIWLESPDAIVKTNESTTFKSFSLQRNRWISKGRSYTDRFTVLLAIVTFVTILTQVSLLIASIFNIHFFRVFIAVYIIKGIADYLIISNTAKRYNSMKTLDWLIPVQILYPLYVIWVVCLTPLFFRRQKN